jgi:high-affinity iron transporter
VKIPLKPFFLGTSILMFVMSISFLGSGIKELIEGDVIDMTSPEWLQNLIPFNDVFDVLGIYPCFETLIPQLLLLLITLMIFMMQGWKEKRKTEAGVLALVLGGLGIHKFYLGKYGKGLVYAALSWTLIPTVLSIAEGIHYLTETPEQFETELAPKPKKAKKTKANA